MDSSTSHSSVHLYRVTRKRGEWRREITVTSDAMSIVEDKDLEKLAKFSNADIKSLHAQKAEFRETMARETPKRTSTQNGQLPSKLAMVSPILSWYSDSQKRVRVRTMSAKQNPLLPPVNKDETMLRPPQDSLSIIAECEDELSIHSRHSGGSTSRFQRLDAPGNHSPAPSREGSPRGRKKPMFVGLVTDNDPPDADAAASPAMPRARRSFFINRISEDVNDDKVLSLSDDPSANEVPTLRDIFRNSAFKVMAANQAERRRSSIASLDIKPVSRSSTSQMRLHSASEFVHNGNVQQESGSKLLSLGSVSNRSSQTSLSTERSSEERASEQQPSIQPPQTPRSTFKSPRASSSGSARSPHSSPVSPVPTIPLEPGQPVTPLPSPLPRLRSEIRLDSKPSSTSLPDQHISHSTPTPPRSTQRESNSSNHPATTTQPQSNLDQHQQHQHETIPEIVVSRSSRSDSMIGKDDVPDIVVSSQLAYS